MARAKTEAVEAQDGALETSDGNRVAFVKFASPVLLGQTWNQAQAHTKLSARDRVGDGTPDIFLSGHMLQITSRRKGQSNDVVYVPVANVAYMHLA